MTEWQWAGENISVIHQARQLPLWTKHKSVWQELRNGMSVPHIPCRHCFSLIVKWSLLERGWCLTVIPANTFLTNYTGCTFSYKIHHTLSFFHSLKYLPCCKGRKSTLFSQLPLLDTSNFFPGKWKAWFINNQLRIPTLSWNNER